MFIGYSICLCHLGWFTWQSVVRSSVTRIAFILILVFFFHFSFSGYLGCLQIITILGCCSMTSVRQIVKSELLTLLLHC